MKNYFFCKTCGFVGRPKNSTEGSILIELILWCFFIVPGLMYSVWRMTSTKKICSSCGSYELIPANSPIARQTLNKAEGLCQTK